jgi:ABC-type nickel/cobalt efflux system permease component RcnA
VVEEHPRYLFHFIVDLPTRGHLVVQDTNYAASEGTSRLALRASPGVQVRGYDGPPNVEQVPIRPVWQLGDAEERLTKRVEVDFGPVAVASSQPRITVPGRSVGPTPALSPRPTVTPKAQGLSRLLDRPAGIALFGLWLTALGLGAAHAIQPGHGKTLVAAAMVGERGAWHRGLVLAIVTTLAHFGVVVLLAALIWMTRSTRYAEIHTGLAGFAGFLIAAVGLWRLGRHLGGHGEHEGRHGEVAIDGRGLIGIGLAGGMIPCWDAVVLVVLAELAGQLTLGLFLLTGFSLGMGAVLVAVALLAGRIREMVPGHVRAAAWERGLGIASGLVLSAIGLYLLVS